MRLSDLAAITDKRMELALDEARVALAQHADRGTRVEESVRALLRQFLPQRLRIGQGEVIDTFEHRSAQTDVVIADEDHPVILMAETAELFLFDGVAAAGEVKTVLTGDHLASAISNSRKFKGLVPQYVEGDVIVGVEPDATRYFRHRPYFLICLESELSLETVHARVSEESQAPGLVDAIFVRGRGWVIDRPKDDAFSPVSPDTVWVLQESETVLFDLLTWLAKVMPRIIHQRPVISAYLP